MSPRKTDDPPSPIRRSTATTSMKSTVKKPRRSGRRPGESGTRDQILESALHLFADRGYGLTTIRAIAERAEVDPALVHHFFGNKEGVFQAAVDSPLSVSATFDDIDAPKQSSTAEEETDWLIRTYLGFWENLQTRYAMTAIYRAGLADSATSSMLRHRVAVSVEAWRRKMGLSSHDDVDVVVTMISSQLLGLAVARYVLKLEPLTSMDYEEFLKHITGPLAQQLASVAPHKDHRPPS